jgi:bifunctional DNase/RNase
VWQVSLIDRYHGATMKLVELVGLSLEASTGAPIVLLREFDAPHRVLPIFVGGTEAASIAVALSGQAAPRPLTHDVMASLVEHLDAHVDAVEVTDLRDGAFVAEISLQGPGGGHRLDTRPSDAIALAVRLGAPLFVSDEVLDEVGAVVPEVPEEDEIDEVVAEFRDFLDEIDPDAFALPPADDGPEG